MTRSAGSYSDTAVMFCADSLILRRATAASRTKAAACSLELGARTSSIDDTRCRARPFAAYAYWQHLRRIRPTVRIPHSTYCAHDLHSAVTEDEIHILALIDADAVLASDRSARINTCTHHLARRFFNARDLIGKATVEYNRGMQITVARMEHVAESELVTPCDLVNPVEHLGKLAARNNRILYENVGGQASHCTECLFARVPHLLTL